MFTSLWSRRAVSKQPAARSRGRRQQRPLHLELLEDRCLLSTYVPGPLVLISNPDPLVNCPPVPNHSPYTADESYVAVNPTNPQNIVAEWMDHGQAGNVAGASFDGGKTWQNVAIPGITQCTGGTASEGVNPWLSFAPNGDLYSIGLAFPQPKLQMLQMLVNKFTDGGLTWSNPIQLNTNGNPARFDDKPSITADPTNPNFVYATWARFTKSFTGNNSETMFARSTDGGQTWQPEQIIHNASGTDFNWGHQIVVLPDGTLIDAFSEGQFTKNHQVALTLLRSPDRGQTWSAPISAVVQEPLVDPNLQPPNAIVTDPDTGQLVEAHPMFPSIAVDPHSGNLYAVWIDARFSNFQYNSIALSMSSDGGFTWSTPIQVNQTPNGVPAIDRQAWNPIVAVAADGTVGVTYYDFRNNTAAPGALTDYWLATVPAPATNPSSWSEVRLTDTSFNLEQAPTRFYGAFFLGDHEGLAAVGNDFVAAWGMPDGSSTNQESVFFRREFNTIGTATAALLPASASLSATSFSAVAGANSGAIVSSPLPASTHSSSPPLPSMLAGPSPGPSGPQTMLTNTASVPGAVDKVQDSHRTLPIRPNSVPAAQEGFVTDFGLDLVADVLAENMALALVL